MVFVQWYDWHPASTLGGISMFVLVASIERGHVAVTATASTEQQQQTHPQRQEVGSRSKTADYKIMDAQKRKHIRIPHCYALPY
jgi:hypothetical protein